METSRFPRGSQVCIFRNGLTKIGPLLNTEAPPPPPLPLPAQCFDVRYNRKRFISRVAGSRKTLPVNFVVFLKTSFPRMCLDSPLSHAVIEIGCVSLADSADLNDPCAAYKKQRRNVTKQTGQCLTLSSVRPDLLSCCCCLSLSLSFFVPAFRPNPSM